MPEDKFADLKSKIISLIKEQLKIDSLVDVTGFVNTYFDEHGLDKNDAHTAFVRDISFKLESLGKVKVIPVEDWKRFYIKKLKFSERNPYWYAIYISVISAGITTIFLRASEIIIRLGEQPKTEWQCNMKSSIREKECDSLLYRYFL